MISFIDGLNVEYGNKYYCFNGKFHREDGPAMEYTDGTKRYFIYGTEYTQEEYERVIKLKAFI